MLNFLSFLEETRVLDKYSRIIIVYSCFSSYERVYMELDLEQKVIFLSKTFTFSLCSTAIAKNLPVRWHLGAPCPPFSF